MVAVFGNVRVVINDTIFKKTLLLKKIKHLGLEDFLVGIIQLKVGIGEKKYVSKI